MNQHPPTDPEIDHLLAARLRRTSPDFELRWRELRAQFTQPPRPSRPQHARWLLWTGGAVASAVALALAILSPRAPTPPPADLVSFEELIALDAALRPAVALLDSENRDALLHLAPDTQL